MSQSSSHWNMDRAAWLLIFVVFVGRRIVTQEIPLKPEITLNEVTGVYLPGESITITCNGDKNSPGSNYNFYKDGAELPVSTTNRVHFVATKRRHGQGDYQCKYGYNVNEQWTWSSLSDSARVTVTEPITTPVISLDQRSGVYVEGEPVTITCNATGDNRYKTFRFNRDGQMLSSSPIATKGNIATFPITHGNQKGRYRCQYGISFNQRHIFSQLSEAITATIVAYPHKPSISLNRPDKVFVRGELVRVSCGALSPYSGSSFYLYRGGQNNPIKMVTAKSWKSDVTFYITDSEETGTANYSCVYKSTIAERHITSGRSDSMEVMVVDPLTTPEITLDQPSGVYVVGETVIITCTVTEDYHDKTFYFYKNNQYLQSHQIVRKDNIGTIPVTIKGQGGRYQCRYKTSVSGRRLESHRSESVTITVADPLTTPVIILDQPSVVYVVGETVTISCTVTRDYRYKTFQFYKDNQYLQSYQRDRKANIVRVAVTIKGQAGRYTCQSGTFTKERWLESHQSESVTLNVADPTTTPVITLDQPSGVYVVGETATISCTVTGDYRYKTFQFYKDAQYLLSYQLVTKDNIVKIPVTIKEQGGRYQCGYGTSLSGRRLESHRSESVSVTVAGLPKPNLSVDSNVALKGEEVTFNCTIPRKVPGIIFYLYRHGETNYSDVQPAAAGFNSVTFTIRNVVHAEGGNYTCLYEADVRGRRLPSALSDSVHVTVGDKSFALEAGVGSAIGLILIVALLGFCLFKKGKCRSSREMRNTAPPGDQSNETLTYAVLNLQTLPRGNARQRDTVQTLGEDSVLYAAVKL